MLFNSQIFIFIFLPLTVFCFYKTSLQSNRIKILILGSLIFYAYWDIRFLPLLLVSIIFNWSIANIFIKFRNNTIIYTGVLFNLLIIGIFKYLNFFSEILINLTDQDFERFNLILPLGISFFTFQQISYLIDLKRNQIAKYNFYEYLLYVSFFPQLIAGPIVRHNQIIHQFRQCHLITNIHEYISRGLVLFSLGLFKKIYLADRLAPLADAGFEFALGPDPISTFFAWFSALSFTLQLYFDFSAYSDMAIGLGFMFGLKIPINFNIPYLSTNIQSFWRRWHITLSSFFRDYLYIPFGGSRSGEIKYIFSIIITTSFCGLWHGAEWSFILWGSLHGIGLIIYHYWERLNFSMPVFISWFITFIFVICGWVLFRAENATLAYEIIKSMFIYNGTQFPSKYIPTLDFVFIALLLSILGPDNITLALKKFRANIWTLFLTASILTYVTLSMMAEPSQEFIYFQF